MINILKEFIRVFKKILIIIYIMVYNENKKQSIYKYREKNKEKINEQRIVYNNDYYIKNKEYFKMKNRENYLKRKLLKEQSLIKSNDKVNALP